MIQISKRLEKMLFIYCWKTAEVLVRLNSIIDHLNDLEQVLKAVFYLSTLTI